MAEIKQLALFNDLKFGIEKDFWRQDGNTAHITEWTDEHEVETLEDVQGLGERQKVVLRELGGEDGENRVRQLTGLWF